MSTRLKKLDLSIGARLGLGFGAVLALMALLLAVTYGATRRIDRLETHLANVIAPRADLAQELEQCLLRRSLALRTFAVTREPAELAAYRQATLQVEHARTQLLALMEPTERAALEAHLGEHQQEYERAAARFLERTGAGPSDAAKEREAQLSRSLGSLIQPLQLLAGEQAQARRTTWLQLTRVRAEEKRLVFALSAITLLVGLLAAVLTTTAVRDPVTRLADAVRQLEKGEFAAARGLCPSSLPAQRDELRFLANATAAMAESLQRRSDLLVAGALVAEAASRHRDATALAEEVLDVLMQRSPWKASAIYLATNGELQCAASRNLPVKPAARVDSLPAIRGAVAPIPLPGTEQGELLEPEASHRRFFACPIRFEKVLAGVMLVEGDGPPAPDEAAFMGDTARKLGIGLQNAAVLERLQQQRLATDRLLAEQQRLTEHLRRSIHEAHHRIKNNLQAVSDFLSLAVGGAESESAAQALQECSTRVQTIAIVHDLLSLEEAPDRVDLLRVAERLIPSVLQSNHRSHRGVDLTVEVQSLLVDSKTGTTVALILNELISNAAKHAFPSDASGRLEVRLLVEGDWATLRVRDRGPGLPAGFELERDAHVGLQVVTALAEQDLDGGLLLRSDEGVCAEVRFPVRRAGTAPIPRGHHDGSAPEVLPPDSDYNVTEEKALR